MNYFLGIDGGGTSTKVAVCDAEGRFVGAEVGAATILYLDDPGNESTRIIRRLAEKILADAGLAWECLSATYAGITGVDWEPEVVLHEARLRDGLGVQNITAVNDCLIALRAGSTAPNRCIICAGTGMNIGVRAADGAEFIYGYYLPYRLQGGGALGAVVLDAVTEAAAGVGEPTALSGVALECSGCATIEEFLTSMTTRKFPFAPQSLVPGLLRANAEGDATAMRIVADFINGVMAYLDNALTRHLPRDCEAELVFSGGVFKGNGRFIVERVSESLAQKFPRLRFVNARLEPVCGALLTLLDKHHGGSLPAGVMKNFEQGCVQHKLIRT